MESIIGLDIGGANTKFCRLERQEGKVLCPQWGSVYHPVWRDPQGLRDVLAGFRNPLPGEKGSRITGVALTMTAELCDVFSSKGEGVVFLVQMVLEAFPDVPVHVWTTEGAFCSPGEIQRAPLPAAAANWLASAAAIAQSPLLDRETVILADMGSTTTDILPLTRGKVLVQGKTDRERLQTGELVYTGLLRTPVENFADRIYLDGLPCRVAREYFAVSGDVYRVLGLIGEEDYDFPAPDGGSRDFTGCARRLARMASAEPEDLGRENIRQIARYLQEKQIDQIMDGIWQVLSRKDLSRPQSLITTGQGSFILEEAARRLSWRTMPWWQMVPGAGPDQAMTAYAVAWLLLYGPAGEYAGERHKIAGEKG